VHFIKKIVNNILEDSKKIKSLRNTFSKTKKPVLILGDGISSIYIQSIINQYEFIITCNLSILNKNLKNLPILYWVMREPDFLSKKYNKNNFIQYLIRQFLISRFKNRSHTQGIFHPRARIFNFLKYKIKNSIFISPYYKLKLDSGDIYESFDGAFQTCLGMALLSGFKNIHCAGFDAWLLSPKNNIRWYSKCSKPDDYDYIDLIVDCPNFLKMASRNAKISVYSYRHYKPKFKFLHEIKSVQKNIYIPEKDVVNYMDLNTLRLWRKEEKSYKDHPDGYEVHK
jgi:hypothetical protein